VAKDEERAEGRRGIERELKQGWLRLVVLHLLAPGEAYGYEIVSKLAAERMGRSR
jgi:DNA-binding PadR family transcriptional regulator